MINHLLLSQVCQLDKSLHIYTLEYTSSTESVKNVADEEKLAELYVFVGHKS